MSREMVQIEVKFLTQTDNAVCIEYEGEEIWIPNSQVGEDSEAYSGCSLESGEDCILVCTEWIATKKGLL